MTLFQALGPFLLCLALLWPLGRMRRWLYQHIFKVGWLLTKNLRSTTALFYVFMLPGLLVHQFIYWLVAGILDVRAERAIAWPETQQIAELKLNFIRLARNTGAFKLALINAAPFLISIGLIWLVAQNVLRIEGFLEPLRARGLIGLGDAVGSLLATPDIFLWLYFLFAIGNTMMPRWEDLRGARVLLIAAAVIFGALLVLGVADEAISNGLLTPLADAFNLLSGIFMLVIGVNLVMTAALGAIESTIERITGDSATFEKGKLIARTRAEVQALHRQEAERLAKERKTARERALAPAAATAGGPPSVYRLALPTPPAPGRDLQPVAEGVAVRRDEARGLPGGTSPAPAPRPALPGLPGGAAEDTQRSAPVQSPPALQPGALRAPLIIAPGSAQDDEKDELPDDDTLMGEDDEEIS